MALLKFNCPITGREVDTDVDLDAQTFAAHAERDNHVDLPAL